jgi:uncharacterized protein YjbJ (UPF0337 family)
MNWDIVQGKWKEFRGEARKSWGKLTDNEWEQIAGDRDKLSGKLQTHYGWAKNDAESKIDEFFRPSPVPADQPSA